HAIEASRNLRGCRAFADKTHRRPVDLQPRHIAGCPDVEAERPTRPLRDRNLVHDQIDGGGTALDRILGEQRNLAWGNDKAVHVVSPALLTPGRQVPLLVGKEAPLTRL